MNAFDILQLLGGVILAVGYIPQIMQLTRTHSCGDLNLKTYLLMTLGIGLMEVYAISLVVHGSGQMFLITNSLSLLLAASISVLIVSIRHLASEKSHYGDLRVFFDDDGVLIPGILIRRRFRRPLFVPYNNACGFGSQVIYKDNREQIIGVSETLKNQKKIVIDNESGNLLCPTCHSYIAPAGVLHFTNMELPKKCPICGQALYYY